MNFAALNGIGDGSPYGEWRRGFRFAVRRIPRDHGRGFHRVDDEVQEVFRIEFRPPYGG